MIRLVTWDQPLHQLHCLSGRALGGCLLLVDQPPGCGVLLRRTLRMACALAAAMGLLEEIENISFQGSFSKERAKWCEGPPVRWWSREPSCCNLPRDFDKWHCFIEKGWNVVSVSTLALAQKREPVLSLKGGKTRKENIIQIMIAKEHRKGPPLEAEKA